MTLKQRKEQFKEKRNAKNPDYARKAECDESKLEMARRFSEYETLGALFRSERDRLQVLTLWSRTLEEVGICWKFCCVKQEWICWHAYQL